MIQLEIKHKLNNIILDQKKKWMRSEDVLMAAIFGTALYLPCDSLLFPILKSSNPIQDGYQKLPNHFYDEKEEKWSEIWPTFKEIQLFDYKIIEFEGSARSELDGIWIFEKDLIIIEAKRPYEIFTNDQFQKYVKALSKNEKLKIWLLSVGKGIQAKRSLYQMEHIENCNILYIEWSAIVETIKNQINKDDKDIKEKRILKDLIRFLERRDLRPYESFMWPEDIPKLCSMEIPSKNIKEDWFHFLSPELFKIPDFDFKLSDEKLFNWKLV